MKKKYKLATNIKVAMVFLLSFYAESLLALPPIIITNEQPLVVNIENGLKLNIYSDRYVIDYQSPDYMIVKDTVHSNELSNYPNKNCSDCKVLNPAISHYFFHVDFYPFKGKYERLDSVGFPELPYRQLELVLTSATFGLDVFVDNVTTTRVYSPFAYIPYTERIRSLNTHSLGINGYYQTDGAGFYDSLYYISNIYRLYDSEGATFSIFPVKYNPIEGYVDIVKKARYTIMLEQHPRFAVSLKGMIENYIKEEHYGNEMRFYDSFTGMEWKQKEAEKGKYAIITNGNYKQPLREFIGYKNSIGYDVSLYEVSNSTATNATELRNFIRGLYMNEATRPKFLLLVGNPRELIYSSGAPLDMDNPPTDLYYGCLERPTIREERGCGGNLYPEIYVGRWSVYSDKEVENIIEKTIKTEHGLFYTSLSDRQVSLFSGTGKGSTWFRDDIVYFSSRLNKIGFPNTFYNGRRGYTKDHMIAELNGLYGKNPFIFLYDGHGGNSYIWEPYYLYYNDIANPNTNNTFFINNKNLPYQPFGFGLACLTNNYSTYHNFGEGFTTSSLNGGVTYFGATTSSIMLPDRLSFLRIFGLLKEDKYNYHIAELTSWAMGGFYSGVSSCTRRRHVEKYNLLGDPSLKIYGINKYDGNAGSYIIQNKEYSDKEQLNECRNINIYPTFTKEFVIIDAPSNIQITYISITDITGKEIKSFNLYDRQIDVSDIPNGIYFIKVKTDNKTYSTKIIINH